MPKPSADYLARSSAPAGRHDAGISIAASFVVIIWAISWPSTASRRHRHDRVEDDPLLPFPPLGGEVLAEKGGRHRVVEQFKVAAPEVRPDIPGLRSQPAICCLSLDTCWSSCCVALFCSGHGLLSVGDGVVEARHDVVLPSLGLFGSLGRSFGPSLLRRGGWRHRLPSLALESARWVRGVLLGA